MNTKKIQENFQSEHISQWTQDDEGNVSFEATIPADVFPRVINIEVEEELADYLVELVRESAVDAKDAETVVNSAEIINIIEKAINDKE